ncbi:response regulator transcription factor [Tellurirhabdus rosea]|uniref:response regulator transcription factor n=1 Tax=Tellurirhabdus rosea TaxID=2674997 RepID=UPI002255E5C0|nr:response regulator transcription factor [Tellurirhabdus rosea]
MNEALCAGSFLLLQAYTSKAQSISDALTGGGYVSCGIFCEPAPALEHLASQQPDFFLTESYLAGVNGYELVRQAKQLCRADCVMRVSDTGLSTHEALTTNLSGYLTPGAGPEEYLTCLRHIRQGRRYVSPALMDWLRDTSSHPEKGAPLLRRLSDREKQVLRLLADGLENDAIADALGISSTTLTSHFANLKQKLGLTTTRQLVIYAARHSLPGSSLPGSFRP